MIPRTEAGQALLGALRDRAAHVHGEMAMVSAINSVEDAVGLIPQIESQARQVVNVRLADFEAVQSALTQAESLLRQYHRALEMLVRTGKRVPTKGLDDPTARDFILGLREVEAFLAESESTPSSKKVSP